MFRLFIFAFVLVLSQSEEVEMGAFQGYLSSIVRSQSEVEPDVSGEDELQRIYLSTFETARCVKHFLEPKIRPDKQPMTRMDQLYLSLKSMLRELLYKIEALNNIQKRNFSKNLKIMAGKEMTEDVKATAVKIASLASQLQICIYF